MLGHTQLQQFPGMPSDWKPAVGDKIEIMEHGNEEEEDLAFNWATVIEVRPLSSLPYPACSRAS